MLNHISNELSETNSCTIAQDPYPWNTSIKLMHLRETMGYMSCPNFMRQKLQFCFLKSVPNGLMYRSIVVMDIK